MDKDSHMEKFIMSTLHLTVKMVTSRRLRWARHVTRMEEGGSDFNISTDKATQKRPVGSVRSKWEDNIKINLKEIGAIWRNWIDSPQDRGYWKTLMNAGLNFRLHKL